MSDVCVGDDGIFEASSLVPVSGILFGRAFGLFECSRCKTSVVCLLFSGLRCVTWKRYLFWGGLLNETICCVVVMFTRIFLFLFLSNDLC